MQIINSNTIQIISEIPEFLPERKTIGSVCLDLMVSEDISIEPGKIQVVSAGIKTVIPM
jgi:dUTPase